MRIPVTWRTYRDRCRPTPPRADTHRRRQLAALVDAYGVEDHRPATAVAADVSSDVDGNGRPIPGEVLL